MRSVDREAREQTGDVRPDAGPEDGNDVRMACFARRGPQGFRASRGATDLAGQVQPWVSFTSVARMGRHIGNAGCNRTGRTCVKHLARFVHMAPVLVGGKRCRNLPCSSRFRGCDVRSAPQVHYASSRAWSRRGPVGATRNVGTDLRRPLLRRRTAIATLSILG